MIKNITIEGFELSVTARVLCDKLVDRRAHCYRSNFDYDELLTQGVYASNDLLNDLGLASKLRVRRRGAKAFVFCEYTHKILAELAVSAETTRFGLRRPRFVLLNRRGFVKEQTIADLLIKSEKIRQYQRFKRRQASNQIRHIEKANQFAKKGAKR